MTNEEFEGHLMAALHGPNAEVIAARVLEVAGIAPAVAATFGLLELAHLDGLTRPGSRLSPRDAMLTGARREDVREGLRSILRSLIKASDNPAEKFAELHLDPNEPED